MPERDVNSRVWDAEHPSPPASGTLRDEVDALDQPGRPADDDWLAFVAEDPAFFIKPSDAV